MSTKLVCDFCGDEIKERICVRVIRERSHNWRAEAGSTIGDLEKDACEDCANIIRRLLSKNIDLIKKAFDAASNK